MWVALLILFQLFCLATVGVIELPRSALVLIAVLVLVVTPILLTKCLMGIWYVLRGIWRFGRRYTSGPITLFVWVVSLFVVLLVNLADNGVVTMPIEAVVFLLFV